MNNAQYAIVDIETTGGSAGGSRITEIAIILHDGKSVVERWESLVNPQREIPFYISALTGISNEMVAGAPTFGNIANKVHAMLYNRIFVAHSVNFDYSFVRNELRLAGIEWTAKKLCTVRATRKIIPGLRSYGLGNICHSLGIGIENRHRAGGDADATAVLFSKLFECDADGILETMIKKTAQDQRLPPNLPPKDFEQLPNKPGVYYFYNAERKVVYVGKAVNIKKRVASHFTGHNVNPQRQHFLRDIHAISFEECATELMALILECSEIRKLWPVYNRSLKRFEAKFGLYEYEARNGYRYLGVGKLAKFQKCVQVFNSEYEGVTLLRNLAVQFGIDHRFCKYGRADAAEFFMPNDFAELPEIEQHNSDIQAAIDYLTGSRPTFTIIDSGRNSDERSCICVEDGEFYGMGYITSDIAIHDPEEIKDHVTRYGSNQYIIQLVMNFAKKYPEKVAYQKNLVETA